MTGIEVIMDDPQWSQAIADADALATRCLAVAAQRESRLGGSVALLLTSDEAVRTLNRQFRNQDKATNVLSFPSGEDGPGFLGDIAVAYGVCAREAAENRASVEAYAAHLIVHGLLHLVGYDHKRDDEAEIMEALESDILDALGVYNPYAAEDTSKA